MSRQLPEVRTDSSLAAARTLWQRDVSSAVGRVLKWVLTLGFVGVVAAAGLGAWRFSDLFYEDGLRPPVDHEPPPYTDGVVVAIENGEITLDVHPLATPAIERDGLYGIRWTGGSGTLGAITSTTGTRVVRVFETTDEPPTIGTAVTVDGMTYYSDPQQAHGISFEEVEIATELGPAPAWHVQGESDVWVVFTHGKGVDHTESLRMLPTVVAAGHPALVLSYRNDVGAPADPSGIYQFGLAEWRDLQSGVQWAREQGAAKVILVGYSMGGAITMEFMHRSPFSGDVAGLILDAPMLDLSRTVDQGAADQGIPPLLTALSKTVAASRFGLNWAEMNYLAKAERLEVPVLLFHGVEDARVPIVLSEDLAAALPELVTYVPFERAGHVESWNVDRDRYEAAVRDHIDRVISES